MVLIPLKSLWALRRPFRYLDNAHGILVHVFSVKSFDVESVKEVMTRY